MNVVAVKKPVVGFESFANEVASKFAMIITFGWCVVVTWEASYFRRSFETCGIVHGLALSFSEAFGDPNH